MKISKLLVFSLLLLLFFILGAVSADDLNSTEIAADGDVKDIYVSDVGNDLNTGASDSPYATIGKAISNVNETEKTTIYLSKGIFSTDDDVNFDIDLNHKVTGGDLKFIGCGVNETFINGQSSFRFAKIGNNSNITFKNIAFINFKANNGGTLYSEGILTVDNCIFNDSISTNTKGGAIFANGSEVYISNSSFVSCRVTCDSNYYDGDGGGAIFANNVNNLYLKENLFINSHINNNLRGFALNIQNSKAYIKGNKFVNITADGSSVDAGIYVASIIDLDYGNDSINTFILNNQFINCMNPSEEYSIVYLNNGVNLFKNNTFNGENGIFLEEGSSIDGLNFNVGNDFLEIGDNEINKGIDLPLNITDDMGNFVKFSSNIKINLISNKYNYSYYSVVTDGFMHVNFDKIPHIGYYSLTVDFFGKEYFLANVSVNYNGIPIELWVSPYGFNGNDGTRDNPFESIGYAIEAGFEKSFNVIIHLLDGVYSGEDNLELNVVNKGSLQIIGENYNDCIIDGESKHWFVKSNTNVSIKNVKFINGYCTDNDLLSCENRHFCSLFLENCIVDRSMAENNHYILNGVSFNNFAYTNNKGNIKSPLNIISNSYFENNTNPNGFGGVFLLDSFDGHIITNCRFINNFASNGGVIYSKSKVTSLNNYYENNHADDSGVIYIDHGYKFRSQNDTFINNSAINNGVIGFALDYLQDNPNTPTFELINDTFIVNHAKKAGVLIMQKGTIANSSFINNSADYGGAIVIMPNNYVGVFLNKIELNSIVFTDNFARVNGNDIYLSHDIHSSWYPNQELFFVLPLFITFNNLTTNYLSDYLTATIHGPCNSIVGGSKVNFKLDNVNVGYGEIVNGVSGFKYNGFENGCFILSGDVDNMYKTSTITDATVVANLSSYISNKEVWVSNDGSDGEGDGSKDNPFKTIKHAIDESTKNCLNLVINIAGGTYSGELNTLLKVSSALNLTLKGENTTVIDGENVNWFIRVSEGKNKITLCNLTIKNMLPDNRKSRVVFEISPITVDYGGNLCLNNVFITNNHGGRAIIENEGNLEIIDSIFSCNAFATKALVSGGNVKIDNTSMVDNFGIEGILACNNILINNSIIKNAFNLKQDYWGGVFSLIEGDCILENTLVLNDGDNSSLKSLGLDEINASIVPALSIENNVFMKNISMINNYNSPINVNETTTVTQSTYLSIFGYVYSGHDGKNITALDCSFYNFKYLWALNEWGDLIFNFDKCLFKNITQICHTRAVGQNSRWVFNNSVFLDVDLYFQRPYYFTVENPTQINHKNGINTVPYDNNFWGFNDKPVIRYADGEQIIFNYSPRNWIVLNNVNGIFKFQLTDGENTSEYNGDLPLSVSYVLSNGEMIPVISVDGKSYPVIFNGKNIKISSNLIESTVSKPIVENTILSDDLTLKYGENTNFTTKLLYPWGDPLANADVTYSVNGENYTALTDENGSLSFKVDFNAGVYDVVIYNPSSKQVSINTIIVNRIKPDLIVEDVSTVYNGGKYLTLNVNAPGNINVLLNGKTIKNQVKIPITLTPNTYTAVVTYEGDVNYEKVIVYATVTVKKAIPKITGKKKVTFKAKKKTKKYVVTLKDNSGKAMKNIKVTLKVKGKTYKATTNSKGKATFKIKNLKKKGKYIATITYKGTKYYNKSYKKVKIVVR